MVGHGAGRMAGTPSLTEASSAGGYRRWLCGHAHRLPCSSSARDNGRRDGDARRSSEAEALRSRRWEGYSSAASIPGEVGSGTGRAQLHLRARAYRRKRRRDFPASGSNLENRCRRGAGGRDHIPRDFAKGAAFDAQAADV